MSVIFAFVAGALSFFSPCIFPLVPAYVAHLTGTPIRENRIRVGKREILMRSLAFIGGFSVIFVLMGATASAIGQMLVQYREFIEKLAGLFIIIFGLQMAGILSFRLLMKEKRWDTSTSKAKGWLSSIFVGMAFAAGWTPCVGLTLSSILLLASSTETLYSGMVLLLVYSLGLGVPFLLLSLAMTKSLQIVKNVNRWLPLLSKVNGWLLVVLGVLLYTGQMAKISALLSSYSIFSF
ncbi:MULTISPECIES: cytochrome c biogenesis CcdA family protein [Geobacillus]|uniref:Cytochrome c biogenesis protein n=2 Tax=Geobacillus TaxID=129337 RepID=Q5KY71_GEOKA|nr:MULTISPECIES: cytochrome c biogenesis protein CcdA [Geobacillus]ALA71656.1 cytochrome C biogenesis protein DsbD [Geobacillus stearothermophilus 10]MED4877122.1 cytochrome c biogenesis protein CcdA [Anoxybacillus geothermalis]WJQ09258.1 cytochrome c biogenesis protein CcdA [Geobacillus stearothermophilus]ESU73412.1 cytochrome C biogenesis protein DsbD [Geobacillus sp. MAS1]TRY42479.1 cytochrome c biogenesis protein CcdA [Geobacillus sp. LEMMJ02]